MFSKFFPNSQSRSHAARAAIPATVGIAIGALAGLAMVAGPASAGIIYQDSFPGSSPNVLAGTAPNIVDTGGAAWTGDTNYYHHPFLADGSTSGGYVQPATLPFAAPAVNGAVYSVSATLDPTGGSTDTNWLTVGFSSSSGGTGGVGPWIALRGNGEIFLGSNPGYSGPGAVSGVFPLGETAQVVLNTTGTDWTADYYYGPANNMALLGTWTYTGTGGANPNPTGITTVGINTTYEPGKVGNFLFQNNAVPEPAALCLMAAAGLGSLLLKRRKTA